MDPNNLIEINEITDIFSYLKSIDWRGELWLYGIGIFHIVTALMAFLVSVNFQIILFSGLCEYLRNLLQLIYVIIYLQCFWYTFPNSLMN